MRQDITIKELVIACLFIGLFLLCTVSLSSCSHKTARTNYTQDSRDYCDSTSCSHK
jgi:hypothetical protein